MLFIDNSRNDKLHCVSAKSIYTIFTAPQYRRTDFYDNEAAEEDSAARRDNGKLSQRRY